MPLNVVDAEQNGKLLLSLYAKQFKNLKAKNLWRGKNDKPNSRRRTHGRTVIASTAQMVAPLVMLGDNQMFYLEKNQPHYFVWPALAVGIDEELWIGIGWLNFEIGWRNGSGGESNKAAHGIKGEA